MARPHPPIPPGHAGVRGIECFWKYEGGVMRLACPICGVRDSREFTYRGSARLLERPDADEGLDAFHDYVNIRENVAGLNTELWHHTMGCSAWLKVERNTVSHEISRVELVREVST